MSTSGVFVLSSVLPPLAQALMIEADLPRNLPRSDRLGPLLMSGQGTLIRHDLNVHGFAVSLSYSSLERVGPLDHRT